MSESDKTEEATQGVEVTMEEQAGGNGTATQEQKGDESEKVAEDIKLKSEHTADPIESIPETPPESDGETVEEVTGGSASVSHDSPGSSGSSHVFSEGWSQLPKEVIVDKIKGIIYGQAIGDAFGLATEFMSREMAKKYYGKKGPSGYSDIVQDFHRSRWKAGDWTDDTDQMLLILLMIVDSGGHVDKVDFAKRILHWRGHGFKELGDYGGMGIGMTVNRTLSHPMFLKEPHDAAREVWERSGRYLAANGAIMRTSILGAFNFNDIEKVVANTVEVCRVTHADPRCSASCIAVTTAIALMLQGKYDPMDKRQLKELVDAAIKEGSKVLEHDDQQHELKDHITASSLDKLKLDDDKTIGYTFKALGAGFYGLRNAKDFRKTILEVIMHAGDADSNGSVCGALMGCKLGFRNLPQDLLQFPHREWMDRRVDSFLEVIGLKERSTDTSDTANPS